ncbi:MAG: response regulator [Burkholderiaceae bacterium]|nr:response regulator [Burkholderiaceae bacterium]
MRLASELETAHILVVEDEPALARLVCDYLRAAGCTTTHVDHGLAVAAALQARPADLLVLDLMLPGKDGLAICRELREAGNGVPVIMVTARVEEIDRLLGLEAGADDYVCKPFSPRELVARIKAILRRTRGVAAAVSAKPTPAPAAAGLQLDEARHRALWNGQDLELTPLEFRLLAALAAQPSRVYGRDQLLDRLHDDQRALSDRAIDSHVKNLRRKVEALAMAQPSPGLQIRSVYGVGYALELDG